MGGMQFGTWDLLFNLVLLVFWFRIWNPDSRDTFFNPYILPLSRLADSAVNFLRPLLVGFPAPLIAGLALAFLAVFRGFVVPSESVPWVLRIGFVVRMPHAGHLPGSVAFSLLSFAVFLFKFWTICLFVLWNREHSSGRAERTVYHLARPLTDLPVRLRFLFLLLFGMAVSSLLNLAGVFAPGIDLAAPTAATPWEGAVWAGLVPAAKLALSTLAGFCDALMALRLALIWLILGSWVCALAGSPGLAQFCREWTDACLGPLRRHALVVGMMDLTPLILILLLPFAHAYAQQLLLLAYLRLS